MNLKDIERKFKNHLLKTVGKKPTKREMYEIDKKIHLSYNKIYDKPNKRESTVKRIYNKELSKLWVKVVANENLGPEIILLSKNIKIKTDYKITSLASGLCVYELFLAKEFVPKGKVCCVDISDEMNKIAMRFVRKLNQNNLEIFTCSIKKVPLKSDSQDIVMARRTGLSKDKKWTKILNESYRILKKNKNSTFLYTVDKVFNDHINTIKSNLKKSNFNFIKMKESHSSNEGTVCMIFAKPRF